MNNLRFRTSTRSSRILCLVENDEINNIQETEKPLRIQTKNAECESPLPSNCNLGDAEFAVLESLIDEELSRDATFSPGVILSESVSYKNQHSEGSVILDSNEHTPVPSPFVDFVSVSSNIPQNSDIDDVQPTPSPVACIPSVGSLISVSECDSPTLTENRKRIATYKTNQGKKRLRLCEQWIDTKRKSLCNSGQEYISRKGKIRSGKQLGPICSTTCKLKCYDKFSISVRKNIHSKFWGMADHTKHWEYINKFSDKQNKKRMTTEGTSRRQYTSKYYLPLPSDEEPTKYERVQVCLKTFTNTLSITDQFIRTAHQKMSQEGATLPDNRGKHSNHPIKITEITKKSVIDHVNSFQPIESHYTRKNTSKLYLDNGLTMHKLFKLYRVWDHLENYENTAQNLRQYRDIVNENMNIAFFFPKKDLCDKCHVFDSHKSPTEEEMQVHSKHLENKVLAREFKESDKQLAQEKQPEVVCATFDFQKILTSPHGDVGLFYYKRKLNVYHFTVFDLAQKEGTCYMWTECTAKRGANEVSSCLMQFIKSKVEMGAKSFLFWSDNCSGQNRNRVVYSMYMLMAQKYNVDITHRFLEQGHTQNEGDSVHARIEEETKGKLIYTPDQWYALVRWAKVNGKPYKVVEITQEDIFDMKVLLVDKHWKKDTANQNIAWNSLREIKVKKEEPNCLYLKYKLNGDTHCLKTLQGTRRGKRVTRSVQIKNLYSDILPLPEAKYKDLMSLCNSGVIPKEYHRFFQNLKHGENLIAESDDSD